MDKLQSFKSSNFWGLSARESNTRMPGLLCVGTDGYSRLPTGKHVRTVSALHSEKQLDDSKLYSSQNLPTELLMPDIASSAKYKVGRSRLKPRVGQSALEINRPNSLSSGPHYHFDQRDRAFVSIYNRGGEERNSMSGSPSSTNEPITPEHF